MHALKIRRYSILSLFNLASLLPLNYLQFITLEVNKWKFPFYYVVIGLPILLLSAWALVEIRAWWRNWIIIALLIIYAGMLLSLIDAASFTWAVRSIVSFSLRGPFLVVAMLFLCSNRVEINKTLNSVMITVILMSFIGISEFILGKNLIYHKLYLVHHPHYASLGDSGRYGMVGTIGHPLPFSAYLVLFMPLFFVKKMRNFCKMCALFIISSCIYLSFSRSSWISLILIMILFFLRKRQGIMKYNVKNAVKISGIIVLAFLAINIFSPKARAIFQIRSSWNVWWSEIFHSHRAASYKTVFNILKENPLWGVGFGNYPSVHKKYMAKGSVPWIETPDNQYLRWLADTGIVGFGCLVAFVVLFFRKFAKAYWKCPDEELKTLMWAMFCGIVGFMVNLMAFDGFFWMAPNFAFWMMIGLLAAAIDLTEKEAKVAV